MRHPAKCFVACLLLATSFVVPVGAQTVLLNDRAFFSCDSGEMMEGPPSSDDAGIVRITGDDADLSDCYLQAVHALVEALAHHSGFDVLVLPVGYFEARELAAELDSARAPYAAETLYRVWRTSKPFQAFLAALAELQDDGLFLAGGMTRFHAAALGRYPSDMLAWLRSRGVDRDTRTELFSLMEDQQRLRDAPPAVRSRLHDLLLRVEPTVAEPTEASHVFSTFVRFVELERIRAGDLPGDGFQRREIKTNLDWIESSRPESRVIYWAGRGGADEPLPTGRRVVEFSLTTETN